VPYAQRFLSEIGLSPDDALALGRARPDDPAEPFNMAFLAMRGSLLTFGVSELHGAVSRRIFAPLFPRRPEPEVPVGHVTNGVHVPTWDSPWADEIWTGACGRERWRCQPAALGEAIAELTDERLVSLRATERTDLVQYARGRLAWQLGARGAAPEIIAAAGKALDANVLTLGFARRFTGYKRPELVFHDPERFARILNGAGRPVQVIFAGKSHPADDIGKHHLQRVYKHALDPMFGGRVAFVDDYDLHVAHFLVQGCDVWLNNPRKPLEASGTSGMKAAINGVPHLSIGDGWWAEGFTGANGWVIDGGAAAADYDAVDAADANALYRLLEEEIVPAFYDRGADQVPHAWVATIKHSIRTVAPRFSARRMVKEYAARMYAPALERKTVGRTP
jgi:glycogen phosphorylase